MHGMEVHLRQRSDAPDRRSEGVSAFVNVFQPLIEKAANMVVIERVVDESSVPAMLDEAQVPQCP